MWCNSRMIFYSAALHKRACMHISTHDLHARVQPRMLPCNAARFISVPRRRAKPVHAHEWHHTFETSHIGDTPLPQINLDDDDEATPSQQSEDVAAVEPPVPSAGPADFELSAPPPPRRRSAVQDERTRKLLEDNRRAIAELEQASRELPIELSDDGEIFRFQL